MNKRVLVISSSFRTKGNSARLAEEFMKGAVEAGNEVEFISLHDKKIAFCRGCLVCQKAKKCVISDDANMIREKMLHADVLVFATMLSLFIFSEFFILPLKLNENLYKN